MLERIAKLYENLMPEERTGYEKVLREYASEERRSVYEGKQKLG